MKRILLLAFLLTFPFMIYAQHSLLLKWDGGISKITNTFMSDLVPDFKVRFHFSWNGGLIYNYKFTEISGLGAEFLFAQFYGKETFSVDLIDVDQNIVGNADDVCIRRVTYLALPLYYEYTYRRFSVNMGMQLSLSLSGKEKQDLKGTAEGKPFHHKTGYSDLNIKKSDYGVRPDLFSGFRIKYPLKVYITMDYAIS